MSRSGIEELFRAPDTQFIRVGADLREYDIEMAKLKGRLEASREGYNELYKIAKELKAQNDYHKAALRANKKVIETLISGGLLSRQEADSLKRKAIASLSPEDQAALR